jgi:hypothetical protein
LVACNVFNLPAVAYADIVPVLSSIAAALGKSLSDMVIFDPFYCQGSVRRHLAAHGFLNVINIKQVSQYARSSPDFGCLFSNFATGLLLESDS